MTTQDKKGLLVVLDGNDGSGKATQASALAAAFEARGTPCLKIDFPRYHDNLMGRFLGACLAGKHGDFLTMDPHITSVIYAADRFESSATIAAALAAGKIVIADRFSSSNQIHQGGKIADEGLREEFLSWLDELEHGVFGIPRPDRIIYLKVPVEKSLVLLEEKRHAKNANLGDGERDQVENDRLYLERSHQTAGWLAARQPNWRVVECMDTEGGMLSAEEIHQQILAAISDLDV